MIGRGEEVGAAGEAFDLVELLLHQVMNGPDVGLEAVLPGRDRAVDLAPLTRWIARW
jgi:hypothetical protein